MRFGSDVQGIDSPWLKCWGRSGGRVVVHCHPSKGLFHAAVMRTVKKLGVDRVEFEAWLRSGRKAR
jgi:hypothetical protein